MKTMICNESKIFYFQAAIVEHLLLLTEEERELRFFKSMNEFQIREWVETLDKKEAEFVLLLDDEDNLKGFGQVSVCRAMEISGDLSLSLDKSVRGQGNGFKLFRQLLQTAKKIKLDKLHIMFKSNNFPVKALVLKFGFQLSYDFGDVAGVML